MAAISRLCVYCGSSPGARPAYRDAAATLGRAMAAQGVGLVYGGGSVGLMGVVADAVIAGGGEAIGVIPRFLHDLEVGHRQLTALEIVETMHARKQRMAELSDGFVVLPGGLGTLDEAFEIITWRQLALHDKPIVLVDIGGYWQPFAALVQHQITEGFVRPYHADLFVVVPTVEDVLPAMMAAPPPRIGPKVGRM